MEKVKKYLKFKRPILSEVEKNYLLNSSIMQNKDVSAEENNIILENIKANIVFEILKETNELFDEISESISSESGLNNQELSNNFSDSKTLMINFIYEIQSFISNFYPSISIDSEGEIAFEWYGKIGARANVTFGKNGDLYFICLFHGEKTSSKLFSTRANILDIKKVLLKIKNDTKK